MVRKIPNDKHLSLSSPWLKITITQIRSGRKMVLGLAAQARDLATNSKPAVLVG